MNIYHQQRPVNVFGHQVATFPEGIGPAFDDLMKKVTGAGGRSYYGISKMDESGKILYWVTAEEKSAGESETFNAERFTIPEGDYVAETLQNWHSELNKIKDIFHNMMQHPLADNTKPCIEWYHSQQEMLCMQQVDPVKALFSALDKASADLLQLFESFTGETVNDSPFEGSWTPAQLVTHVTKANAGIIQALDMEGTLAKRKPTERVAELESIFLNFEHKMNSPVFIQPPAGIYHRQPVIDALNTTNEQLREKRSQVNLSEEIDFFAFGRITRIELLHFVLYHTQRHIHQLNRMTAAKKA